MAVKKEYRCLAHGPFESMEEICPHGCSTVVREFRTAPGGRSAKTKTTDRALQGLANRYGLTDMSNKSGSVGGSRKQPQAMAPVWGEMPKGNVFEVGKGEVAAEGAAGGSTAALAALGINEQTAAAALAKHLGKEVKPEPTFMDIQKQLPKRIRPILPGKEYSYGSSSQLDALMDKK